MRVKKILMFEYFLVFCIAVLAAWTVYAQSLRFTPLIDYSYQVENSYRIYMGDMPYRDFFMVLPPGIYWVLAVMMKIFGGYAHFIPTLYMCTVTFFIVILTYAVLRQFTVHTFIRIILLTVLISGGHAMVLNPSYDVASGSIITGSVLWMLLLWKRKSTSLILWFISGVLIAMPQLFKQNIGLMYLISMILTYGIASFVSQKISVFKTWLAMVSGSVFLVALYAGWAFVNHAFTQWYYQLFVFTLQVLDPLEPVKRVSAMYSNVLIDRFSEWVLKAIVIILLTLAEWKFRLRPIVAIASGLITIIILVMYPLQEIYDMSFRYFWPTLTVLTVALFLYLFVSDKRNRLDPRMYLAIPLLATVHMPRATYGMFPLGVICIAWFVHYGKKSFSAISIEPLLITAVVIFAVGLRYGTIHIWNVMGYRNDGPLYTSHINALNGLSTPGMWLPNMEDMFSYVNAHIPKDDAIAFLPGEDPFYAYTKRRNPLPYSQMGPDAVPNDVSHWMDLLRESDVRWIIIKTDVQCPWGYVDMNPYIKEFSKYYYLVEVRNNYSYYRRR